MGNLSTVTDGLNHTWDYDYVATLWLTKVTDPAGKVVRYAYDSAKRVTKAGAGAAGTTDATEYVFSGTTGLVSKVRYGSGSYDADYFYDGAARLTEIEDWLTTGGDGLRYAYDDAGRLTQITDYDDSTLDYTYDAAGNIITMDDYHSHDVVYTYTNTNQVSTITAPGSKTWDFDYNAIGQATQYSHPNGMTSGYAYDNRGRLTKLEHKDGETVKDSFTYSLDSVGNVTMLAQADGSEWTYEYDGRHRLSKAQRENDGNTIAATYEYMYDDGDNLVTRVEPFVDDFNDTNYTGWTVRAGTWSASSGAMRNTVSGGSWSYFGRSQADADYDLQFTYVCNDDSDSGYTLRVEARFTGWSDDRLCLYMEPDRMILKEMVDGGSWTWLCTNASADTEEGTKYIVRMECDDDDIAVWRGEVGGDVSQVLSTSSASVTTTNNVYFDVSPGADYSVDDIRIIADNLSRTTAFAYDDANELTSMTNNGTVNFAYDEWGRMTSKSYGQAYTATYAYGDCHRLSRVTSTFPHEGTVTYRYGGNRERRSRRAGTDAKWYNWMGATVINEENGDSGAGSLSRTYIGRTMAHVNGTNPSTGTYKYCFQDHLSSTRRLRAPDGSSLGQYEFTPFGAAYAFLGNAFTYLYTGHDWDATAGLYFAPLRCYSPTMARWTTRDPLGMVDGPNLYTYVRENPVGSFDPLGLYTCIYCIKQHNMVCFPTQRGNPYFESDLFLCGNNCNPKYPNAMNNPNKTHVDDHGPLPPGQYTIGPPERWHTPNKLVWRYLDPDPCNDMGTRGDLFIHGANMRNPATSGGCIACTSPRVRDLFLEKILGLEEGRNTLYVVKDCNLRIRPGYPFFGR